MKGQMGRAHSNIVAILLGAASACGLGDTELAPGVPLAVVKLADAEEQALPASGPAPDEANTDCNADCKEKYLTVGQGTHTCKWPLWGGYSQCVTGPYCRFEGADCGNGSCTTKCSESGQEVLCDGCYCQ